MLLLMPSGISIRNGKECERKTLGSKASCLALRGRLSNARPQGKPGDLKKTKMGLLSDHWKRTVKKNSRLTEFCIFSVLGPLQHTHRGNTAKIKEDSRIAQPDPGDLKMSWKRTRYYKLKWLSVNIISMEKQ